MRVLHLSQRYWPAIGGAESYLAHISEQLVANGHAVTVATTDALDIELFWNRARRRIADPRSTHRGVSIRRFPVRHLPFPQLSYPAVRRLIWLLSAGNVAPVAWLNALSRFTPWVPDLWRWLATDETEFDLVAASTICFEPLILAGLQLARRRKLPFVCYPLTHLGAGTRPGEDALSRFYTMRHQVALVRGSDAVVAMTASEREFYRGQGIPEEKIAVAGPGIDPAEVLGGDGAAWRARNGLSAPIIASLSTLMYDKGTVHVVEAVRGLWQAGVAVELVLAGAPLEPFVQYLAALPPPTVNGYACWAPCLMRRSAICWPPQTFSPCPAAPTRSGSCTWRPGCTASRSSGRGTWGVTDVITDGQDGMLVPFGDMPALTAALRRLLDSPERREALGEAGRAKVYAQHTWARKFPKIEALYTRLAARKP